MTYYAPTNEVWEYKEITQEGEIKWQTHRKIKNLG